MVRSIVLAAVVLCGVADMAIAQSTPTSSIVVEKAWARATPGSSKTGVAYLTVVDHGSAADRLIGVSSPVAARGELHTTSNVNGVMKMSSVDAIPVEPGKPIELKPGGYHIMLVDLKQPLKEGESFPLTLKFEKSGTVQVSVKVGKVGAMAPMTGMKSDMKM